MNTTYAWMAAGIVLITAFGGCKDSSSETTSTTTTPPTGSQVRDNLDAAGQHIKDAANAAATQADPMIEAAKEKTKQAFHDAADKVSTMSSTAPSYEKTTTTTTVPPTTQP